MKIQITNRYSGAVIFETDAETLGGAVAAAIAANANLKGAYLEGAYLEGAYLKSAYLKGAYLKGAYLKGANLEGAYLKGANLEGAHLEGAHLEGANLEDAHLKGANLEDAHLKGANLEGAYLKGANLKGAHLEGAQKWEPLLPSRTILPDGDLVGWKQLKDGVICKLKIPAKAKRVGGLIGRKCRAEYAVVISGEGVSQHDSNFKYAKGKTVKPDSFDPDPRVECSHGIHFFITREEAEAYV